MWGRPGCTRPATGSSVSGHFGCRGRRAVGCQCGVCRMDHEPHPADPLAIGLGGLGIAGEPVEGHSCERHLEGVIGAGDDSETALRHTGPTRHRGGANRNHQRRPSRGARTGTGGGTGPVRLVPVESADGGPVDQNGTEGGPGDDRHHCGAGSPRGRRGRRSRRRVTAGGCSGRTGGAGRTACRDGQGGRQGGGRSHPQAEPLWALPRSVSSTLDVLGHVPPLFEQREHCLRPPLPACQRPIRPASPHGPVGLGAVGFGGGQPKVKS
jgi:hypothetical protein